MTTLASYRQASQPWQRLADATVLLLLLVGYLPVFSLYARQHWSTGALQGAYQHAWMALAIVAWLVWRQRKYLADLPRVVNLRGLGLLGAGIALKVYGEYHAYDVLQGLSVIPVLAGLVILYKGVEAWKKLRFPILFLLAIIPLPSAAIDALTIPMLSVTGELSRWLLPMTGLQVEGAGQLLWVSLDGQSPVHEIILASECSGIRSLVALLALSCVFAYLRGYTGFRFLAMVAITLPLTLLGNVARVMVIALLIVHVRPDAAETFLHEASGIMLFIINLLGLIAVDHWLMKPKGRAL